MCWLEPPSLAQWSTKINYRTSNTTRNLMCWLEPTSSVQWSTRIHTIKYQNHYMFFGTPVHCLVVHQDKYHQMLDNLCPPLREQRKPFNGDCSAGAFLFHTTEWSYEVASQNSGLGRHTSYGSLSIPEQELFSKTENSIYCSFSIQSM